MQKSQWLSFTNPVENNERVIETALKIIIAIYS